MPFHRWIVALAAIAVSICPIGSRAGAETAEQYPTKPVTLIVPFAPGVSADLLLRGIAEVASKHLGQPIVIDNKAGGSGTLGPAYIARQAKPDGYTIGQLTVTSFRLPVMQKTPFDPSVDFTYIMVLGGYSFGIVVKSDSPYKSWADVVSFAKANPGRFTYTTIGRATTGGIAMELIARQAGVQMTHIPGKGGGEGIASVMGGHVMAMTESPSWAPMVEAKEMRLLMTLGSERSKRWPDVPALKELGYTFDFDSPFGIVGPKGLDPAIAKKIHDAFKKAYDDPTMPDLYRRFDFERRYLPTEDYQKVVPKWIADEKSAMETLGLAKKE